MSFVTLCLATLLSSPSTETQETDIDLKVARTPLTSFSADSSSVAAANHRHFFLAHHPDVLLSYTETDLSNQTFTLSRLPKDLKVGSRSLVYRKDATSSEFVFTNSARTEVYYGDSSSGNPVVNVNACTNFVEISDIHLAENSGALAYLIVADKGADAVYSFVLDPSGSDLCTTMQTLSVSSPLWIQSLDGNPPTIYIGSKDSSGLNLRAYQADDWSPLSAALTLTTSRRARYGRPLFDSTSNELLVPVINANDANGSDFYITYDSALSSSTLTTTCRSPETLHLDYEGASRYRYIFCPSQQKVEVRNTSHALQYSLPTGAEATSALVGSDGTSRYVTILQKSGRIALHKTALAATIPTTTTLNLAGVPYSAQEFIGSGVAADTAVVSIPDVNALVTIDLNAQSLTTTLYLPRSVESLQAASSTTAYFVSPAVDTAYEISELETGVFTLQLFSVGDHPIQVGYRTNRLYVLNRDGNSLSIINLSTRATSTLSTGTRPIHFDFSTAVDRLWIANETSQSLTLVDITVGSEALAAGSPLALGFTPKKVIYHASDTSLFVLDAAQVLAINAPTLATVTTHSLATTATDMTLTTAGVAVSSRTGNALYLVTRTTQSTLSLSVPPQALVSNGAVAFAAGATTFESSSSLSDTVASWNSLSASPTQVIAYSNLGRQLRLYPISLMTDSNFGFVSHRLESDIDRISADASSNLWLAHSTGLRFHRISSAYQLNLLRNRASHHPSGLAVWDAQDKVYTSLRNLDAIAITDAALGSTTFISTCQAPGPLILDSSQNPARLFVLCRESNLVAAITLTAAGLFSSQTFIATGLSPVAMALSPDTTNRLAIANAESDTVSFYNSVSLALVSSLSVSNRPSDIIFHSASQGFRLAHEGAQVITTITSGAVVSTVSIAGNGLSRLSYNSSTGRIFGIHRHDLNFYLSSSVDFSQSGTSLIDDEIPDFISTLASSSKTYVTYPTANAVRIYDESGILTDKAVGDQPSFVQPHASSNKVFISNYGESTLSVLNLSTNALASTISLTSDCGPTLSSTLSVGATNYIYVLCQDNDSLEVINSSSEVVGSALSLR